MRLISGISWKACRCTGQAGPWGPLQAWEAGRCRELLGGGLLLANFLCHLLLGLGDITPGMESCSTGCFGKLLLGFDKHFLGIVSWHADS